MSRRTQCGLTDSEVLTDARKQWQQERDLQKWPEERCSDESKRTWQNQQIFMKEMIEEVQKLTSDLSIGKQEQEYIEAIELTQQHHEGMVSLITYVEKRQMKEKFENDLAKMKVEHEKIINNLQQRLESEKADAEITKRLLDSLKRESDTDKKVAEQLKKQVKMLKASVKDAQDVAEQRSKWFQESQVYINRKIKQGVEDKMKEEQEKMKKDLQKIREWEVYKGNFEKSIQEKIQKELEMQKENFEINKKEEGRRRVEVEIEKLKKKFMSELEVRVAKEKSRLEQEVLAWKKEEKKRMEEDRNKMFRPMERALLEERKIMLQIMENAMNDMRKEMGEEMRKMIQKERVEWDRQKEESDSSSKGSGVGWQERLQSEAEARTKACNDRDEAIEFMQPRELWGPETQTLIDELKQREKEHEKLRSDVPPC